MGFIANLKSNATSVIAILVLGLSYIVLFSIIFYDFPSDQKDIYYSISGGVLSVVTMIVSYYFGASKTDIPNTEKSNTEK
jgi:hypothetical protein